MKIGIPKALLCFIYFPLWRMFFSELGHEVILSSNTNKKVLNSGVLSCVDDACLPVKLMHGHVIDLVDKADIIFIPRLISIYPKEFICPKFIGIPEMIKNSVKSKPRLLVLDFNARKSIRHGYEGFYNTGRQLGASDREIRKALKKAVESQEHYEDKLINGDNPLTILDKMCFQPDKKRRRGTIGLLGHPYLIYDRYVSMDACSKLAARGYHILFPENIPPEQIESACSIYPKKLFWSYGKHLLGSCLTIMENKMADGIILLTSFGCGIDSFIIELLQRRNQRDFQMPFTVISLDEHSGNAGFDTRLEAFIDMMEWRNTNGYHISPHGESIHISQSTV